jgi:hypothetical protein
VPAPAHNAVHSRIKRVAIFICDATPRYRITLTQTARRPFIPGRAGAHPYRAVAVQNQTARDIFRSSKPAGRLPVPSFAYGLGRLLRNITKTCSKKCISVDISTSAIRVPFTL